MFWEYNNELPEVSRSSENGAVEKVSVSYNLPKGYDWRDELPSVGAYCEGFGYYTGYQLTEQPGYDVIRMNFAASPTTELPGRDNRKSGDTVWQIHYFSYDRDLRLHPAYRTFWNYNLAAKKGTTQGVIDAAIANNGFGKTATDITLNDAQKTYFRWVTDTAEIPEDWGTCLYRKYTFDSYKDWSATATATTYFKDFASASEAVSYHPAVCAVPVITVPQCSKTGNKWMLDDVNVGGDGNLFTMTAMWSYNPNGYVAEIYPG